MEERLSDIDTTKINSLKKNAKLKKKKSAIVFTVTTKKFKENIRYLPYRIASNYLCLPIAINNDSIIKKIIKKIDGQIDIIFVDTENKLKNCQNLYQKISALSKHTKIFPIKGNDFTADAAFYLLISKLGPLNNKKICIIGSGNIGSKLALKIIESGTDVYIINSTKTSSEKTAQSINIIKPKECKNKAIVTSKKEIPKNLDAIIGFTSIPVITDQILTKMKKNGLVIDGGVGTIKKELLRNNKETRLEFVRVDVKNAFKAQVELILSTESFVRTIQGRKTMRDFDLVSGGIIGKFGDVVVNNVSRPKEIIGIADGEGGLLKNTKKLKKNLLSTSKKFKISLDKNT